MDISVSQTPHIYYMNVEGGDRFTVNRLSLFLLTTLPVQKTDIICVYIFKSTIFFNKLLQKCILLQRYFIAVKVFRTYFSTVDLCYDETCD